MEAPRWSAPRIELTEENIRELLRFVARNNEAGTYRFFKRLATTRPEFRLARNIAELISQMSKKRVEDVLIGGFSPFEDAALARLEQWGVPLSLLGVAHSLLNVRERRQAARAFDDLFESAKAKHGSTLSTELLAGLVDKWRKK